MIRFSALLVAAATILLIAGVVTSELALVYVAIGVSAVALLALGIGAGLKRNELFGPSASAQPGGAAAQPAEAGQSAPPEAVPVGAAGTQSEAAGWGGEAAWSPTQNLPTVGPATGSRAPWEGSGLPQAGRFDTGSEEGGFGPAAAAYAPPARPARPARPTERLSTVEPEALRGAHPDVAQPDVARPDAVASDAAASEAPGDAPGAASEAGAGTADESTSAETPTAAAAAPAATVDAAGAATVDDADAAAPGTATAEPAEPAENAGPAGIAEAGGIAEAVDDAEAAEGPQAPPSPATAETATETTALPTVTPAPEPDPQQEVTVVPGVPRYHDARCILIRFMGEDDLEKTTLAAARKAGCTPCRACLPEQEAD